MQNAGFWEDEWRIRRVFGGRQKKGSQWRMVVRGVMEGGFLVSEGELWQWGKAAVTLGQAERPFFFFSFCFFLSFRFPFLHSTVTVSRVWFQEREENSWH